MKNNFLWNVTPCSLVTFTDITEKIAASIFEYKKTYSFEYGILYA
jgi:hypothetical protein